ADHALAVAHGVRRRVRPAARVLEPPGDALGVEGNGRQAAFLGASRSRTRHGGHDEDRAGDESHEIASLAPRDCSRHARRKPARPRATPPPPPWDVTGVGPRAPREASGMLRGMRTRVWVLLCLGACSPGDVLQRQASMAGSKDYSQMAIDAKRKADAKAETEEQKQKAIQEEIQKHAQAGQAHFDLGEDHAALKESE